ncbi:MAG: hypothetical protein A2V59_01420 [Armatimonadetes bacterium RBG_19FT_COMBO_69_19]|nr:MAG: hypothetical protein A2V59_01420 [Armatimonadetes bacterium RBG_19FT_COMBO_69_19]
MKRNIGRTLAPALLGILLIAGVPVWAQGISNPIGQPSIVVRSEPSYHIWADQGGWHVRWTTPYAGVFSGTITSDGEVRDLRRAAGGTPAWLSRFGTQRIIFGTVTAGRSEGFDFQTTGSTVTFSLLVNGFQVRPWQVFVGRASQHPAGMPFTASASPAVLAQQGGSERPRGVDIREINERQREGSP